MTFSRKGEALNKKKKIQSEKESKQNNLLLHTTVPRWSKCKDLSVVPAYPDNALNPTWLALLCNDNFQTPLDWTPQKPVQHSRGMQGSGANLLAYNLPVTCLLEDCSPTSTTQQLTGFNTTSLFFSPIISKLPLIKYGQHCRLSVCIWK